MKAYGSQRNVCPVGTCPCCKGKKYDLVTRENNTPRSERHRNMERGRKKQARREAKREILAQLEAA